MGPFTLEALNRAIQERTVSMSSGLAWYEGCKDWIPLSSVPGVQFPPPPAATSLPPPPPPAPPSAAPPPLSKVAPEGDATGGIIPYKNPQALIAYYLGLFSIIPVLGFFLAIPALFLGFSGLKKYRENPVIKGTVHAWIGIVFSVISICYHLFIALAILLSRR